MKNKISRPSGLDLYRAVEGRNKEKVRSILESCLDVNITDEINSTPLHTAATNGDNEILELLLKSKANVEISNKAGMTPLHCAANSGHSKCVELLLREKAFINAKSNKGNTPLHLAVMKGDIATIETLIKENADKNIQNDDGLTPLHYIVRNKLRIEIVSLLLSYSAKINIRDNNGLSPLHDSVSAGNLDMIHLLIKNNAELDIKDKNNCTPLFCAVRAGRKDIVQVLLNAGANANARDKDERTPIFYTVKPGLTDIAKLLLTTKGDVNVKDKNGSTPLLYAAEEGSVEITELFINQGAHLNVNENSGLTLLHLVSARGHKQLTEIFLNKGLPVNVKNIFNYTPLHLAALNGMHDIVELLIIRGANIEVENTSNNATPLYEAAIKGHQKVIITLLKKGALFDTQTKFPKEKREEFKSILAEATFADNLYKIDKVEIVKFKDIDFHKNSIAYERLKTLCLKNGLPNNYRRKILEIRGLSDQQKSKFITIFDRFRTSNEKIVDTIEADLAEIVYYAHPKSFPTSVPYSLLKSYASEESSMKDISSEHEYALKSYNSAQFQHLQPVHFVKYYLFNELKRNIVVELFIDCPPAAERIFKSLSNMILSNTSFVALNSLKKSFAQCTTPIVKEKLYQAKTNLLSLKEENSRLSKRLTYLEQIATLPLEEREALVSKEQLETQAAKCRKITDYEGFKPNKRRAIERLEEQRGKQTSSGIAL